MSYESDSGTNRIVYVPPLVSMTEAALASPGTRFTGTSTYTNAYSEDGQSFAMVTSTIISGVVSATGTVSVVAGTFNNCLASVETITTTTRPR